MSYPQKYSEMHILIFENVQIPTNSERNICWEGYTFLYKMAKLCQNKYFLDINIVFGPFLEINMTTGLKNEELSYLY